jgi:hypothetical protein
MPLPNNDTLDRTNCTDATFGVGTRRFIDSHVTPGETPAGAVGIARTRSVGPQEGVTRDRRPVLLPRLRAAPTHFTDGHRSVDRTSPRFTPRSPEALSEFSGTL